MKSRKTTLNTESIDYDFRVGLFNMAGLTREKWENVVEYLKGIPVLVAIILSETHMWAGAGAR